MPNSLSGSVAPLVLEPGPSRWVRGVTLGGFLLALISIAVLPFPVLHKAIVLMLLAVMMSVAWRQHHALSGKPVTVRLDSDGRWYWQDGEQNEPLLLLDDSYHMPFLVILNFRPEAGPRPICSLLLTTDNIDTDTLRRLRVFLHWQWEKEAKKRAIP